MTDLSFMDDLPAEFQTTLRAALAQGARDAAASGSKGAQARNFDLIARFNAALYRESRARKAGRLTQDDLIESFQCLIAQMLVALARNTAPPFLAPNAIIAHAGEVVDRAMFVLQMPEDAPNRFQARAKIERAQ